MFEILRTKKRFHSYIAGNFFRKHTIFNQQKYFVIVIIKIENLLSH